jgi:hypothetical protein
LASATYWEREAMGKREVSMTFLLTTFQLEDGTNLGKDRFLGCERVERLVKGVGDDGSHDLVPGGVDVDVGLFEKVRECFLRLGHRGPSAFRNDVLVCRGTRRKVRDRGEGCWVVVRGRGGG